MIEISRKEDCVGCNACVQICPKQCISMNEDEQGFLYPKVDVEKCINCHLCEKVCPIINQGEPHEPQIAYAAKNNDQQIQDSSSSGGVFYALAKYIIDNGGVVFGARFNSEWEVIHDYVDSVEDISVFQTSKYVQSKIGYSYKKVRDFLNVGRKVLFSGTPCQIAGLERYLKKDYGIQLIKVDFICHGVPSPGIWRAYLESLTRLKGARKNSDFQSTLIGEKPVITGINFRDKRLGWEKFGFSVHAIARKGDQNTDFQSSVNTDGEKELLFEPHYENLYMQGFLKNLYLRPACYSCPAKNGKSNSDLTLADFWGIEKSYPDLLAKGYYSLVLCGSENGVQLLDNVEIKKNSVETNAALMNNKSFYESSVKPIMYLDFWLEYKKSGLKAICSIINSMHPSIYIRIRNIIGKLLFLLSPKYKKNN